MFTINAEVRKEQGKGASRRLRAANKFPAIIYGGAAAPVAIELENVTMVMLWLPGMNKHRMLSDIVHEAPELWLRR